MPRDAKGGSASERRVEVALAAHRGDLTLVRAALGDADAKVRAAALSALARAGELDATEVDAAIADPDPLVRRQICELSTSSPPGAFQRLLSDPDAAVVEAACFACGEQEIREAVDALALVAVEHNDPLCRESAVAALGVLGLDAGLDAVLKATDDVAAVRRRAVVALSNFESDRATEALQRALHDRDWQVRQAAEDVLGINRTSTR